ncbi:restriction endonuclease subunit S [Pseudoalteromonas sp. Angola-31]|nr:restriction endonuclease subunit S [Pseudoalteromonas sp. Angola-31]
MTQKNWPLSSLVDTVKFVSGGTPNKSQEKYWGGAIPWVSSGAMGQERIYHTELNVTEEGLSNGTRLAPKYTIFVVVRGMSLAKEFRISLAMKEMSFNQDVKAIYPCDNINPIFLYYYLKSQAIAIRDSASEAAHGTKKLDLPVLEQWPLPIPPLDIQSKIANFLFNYDELIENNSQQISLLENMAEEIYREWFVRFRFPNYESTEFAKGLPKSWELNRVDSLGKIITGKTPSTANSKYYDGDIHFIKTPDMHGQLFVIDTEEKLTIDGLESQPSQIIPKNSISVSCIGTGGIVSISTQECCTNQQINTLIPKNDFDLSWAYYAMKMLKPTILAFGSTGTTMTNLSKGKFSGIKLIVPPLGLRKKFHEIIEPIFNEIHNLTKSNILLKQQKKLLLPRLISGKLSIEDLDIKFPTRI